MARDHARIYLSVWNDDDWRSLTSAAQHTYWTLMAQPRLSYCGVLDYFPSRLAELSTDQTEAKVKASVKALERARFVVLDSRTHELVIRSYVRHDGVLDRVNMGKAVGRAFDRVISTKIREAIAHELGRLMADRNDLSGWIGLKEQSPMAFDMASAMASRMESTIGRGE
jgi:hypothetical protein